MEILNRIRVLLLIFCFAFGSIVSAQVVVERSKDKAIISGVQYYMHKVKKGETAYSISRAYGITVEELTRENPPVIYGVKEGQILNVPVIDGQENIEKQQSVIKVQRDESRFTYHRLQPGETVYSLSKAFGVSENEIIQANPGIEINKLSIGAEIAIPRREFMNAQQKFDESDKKYIYHKVVKGESLSSIARQYGLTVRELRRENRELRFPQVGDYIRIPGIEPAETQRADEQVIPDTSKVKEAESGSKELRPSGYTPVKNLKGSFDVAVLLPFYLQENANRIEIDSSKSVRGSRIYKVNNKPDEWIYPLSFDFVEMYNGILLAADTLRAAGLDISIHPYDIKSDTIGLHYLIESGKLAGMDLIIGPVYSYNLTRVAGYAKRLGIPVVSPVPLINNTSIINNPTLFMANSSLEVAQETLAKKLTEFSDNNFVFIHTDTASNDNDVKRFKNLIISELTKVIPYEDLKFREFIFYSRSMFDNDSINRLSHTLSEHTRNIVIIASEEAPVISETIMDLHGLSKRFDITIFGYPAMRDIDNLDPKYLFDLNILTYSPYWIDYNQIDVKRFNIHFRQKFLTEPLERSYAWEGYDIAYYFLSGLAIFGKEFISNPGVHYPDLLQSEFEFVRKDNTGGFENRKLFPVRHTKEYEVKLAEETDSLQKY